MIESGRVLSVADIWPYGCVDLLSKMIWLNMVYFIFSPVIVKTCSEGGNCVISRYFLCFTLGIAIDSQKTFSYGQYWK